MSKKQGLIVMQSNCFFAIFVFTCIFPSTYCDGLLRIKRNGDENNVPEKQLAEEDIENKRNRAKQLCIPHQEFVWCIPPDYDQWKEPWRDNKNVSFPWVYRFTFIIVEIQRVNDSCLLYTSPSPLSSRMAGPEN